MYTVIITGLLINTEGFSILLLFIRVTDAPIAQKKKYIYKKAPFMISEVQLLISI
jgi:hypothetical protein